MLYGDESLNALSDSIIHAAIEVHRELGPGLLEVANQVVVEIKSIERFCPIHLAAMLTYLRVTNLRLGLLLNFNTPYMRQGIKRIMR